MGINPRVAMMSHMSRPSSISLRMQQALGSNSWRGFGLLCIRAVRGRLNPRRSRAGENTPGFDQRFGVSTSDITPLSALHIDSPHKEAGTRYEPTDPAAFAQLIAHLPSDLVSRAIFIDVGCGCGRVLLLAAEYGFRKIIGIEFAQELCDAAHANIARYRTQTQSPAHFRIEQEDACVFRLPLEPTVLFLYNPFNEAVMSRFVRNVEESISETPRSLWAMYSLPFWRRPWETSAVFRRAAGTHVWAEHWYAVYRND